MTLSTHVYLLTEADPRDVFFECRRLLGATDAHRWEDKPSFYGEPKGDERVIMNGGGQGLPAWLIIRYSPNGPLLSESEGHDECDDDCTFEHDPAHWVNIDFDTAYSYKDSYGGCGALHARLLFDLGQWLDDRGIDWSWRNEFTGEIHGGDERYRRLGDLTEGGRAAMRWFKGTVEPVIYASLASPSKDQGENDG
jgi:hypothetical protein